VHTAAGANEEEIRRLRAWLTDLYAARMRRFFGTNFASHRS